ncbi:uncharacterized protein F4812DRAFT_25290 [Daldinia caldariorum]|uniref:uncharacterized protein n=1 Tax=Daldinia caldariorum TaxID=326644 RepID=UPI002007F192|nr:uncharacterized protein F4812DRAFT_25290 [Daldinia caldariorum]KAI1472791.1 hypothetical protein F4812DRAFT_25290 [Daldinia caldariorum]
MSSSPQITKKSEPAHPAHPAITFAINCRNAMRDEFRPTASLNSVALSKLNVKCTQFDLDSGTPNDGGPKVLEPKPLEEMNAIAKRNKLMALNVVASIGEFSSGPYYTAETLGAFFFRDHILEGPDEPSDEILPELGSWEFVPKNHQFVSEEGVEWRAEFTLYSRDKSMLDAVRFLPHTTPFKHDELLFSELWCILATSGSRLAEKKEHEPDEIAPVTIVSACGRDLRVVQGYIHDDKAWVRMSEVVNTDDDDKQVNLDRLLKVAAWFLGTPCRYRVEAICT